MHLLPSHNALSACIAASIPAGGANMNEQAGPACDSKATGRNVPASLGCSRTANTAS